MPYVKRPFPQAIDFIDPGVKDVYHSENVYVNQVPIALWLAPGANGAGSTTSIPPDPQVLDYAPNPEQRAKTARTYYNSFANPEPFYGIGGGVKGKAGSMSGVFDPPGSYTNDANDLSGNPPMGPISGGSGALPEGVGKRAQEMYDYLRSKGVPDAQAQGMIANAIRESGLRPGVLVTDTNGKPSGGLFQWNGERFSAMTQAVPDWRNNWQGQLDYALTEPRSLSNFNMPAFLGASLTPEQASAIWAYDWERPKYPAAAQQQNLINLNRYF